MRRDATFYLSTIQDMAAYLLLQTKKYSLEEYLGSLDAQLAVERAFIIIGEAMTLLGKHHPDIYSELELHASAISFRNFLGHRYWDIDHDGVWSTMITRIPPPKVAVQSLMERLSSSSQ